MLERVGASENPSNSHAQGSSGEYSLKDVQRMRCFCHEGQLNTTRCNSFKDEPYRNCKGWGTSRNMQAGKSNPATSLASQCWLTSYSSACIRQRAMTVESHDGNAIPSFASQETKLVFGIFYSDKNNIWNEIWFTVLATYWAGGSSKIS